MFRYGPTGVDPTGVDTNDVETLQQVVPEEGGRGRPIMVPDPAQVKCFTNNAAQTKALAGLNLAFPDTPAQETAYIASSRALGKACSITGRPLSASMSTAEVARDMDVLRRAVGDRKLSYLGFSYGTYLGQVYANMYPDRVRAVAIDGVLDPVAWAGTPATANIPQTTRL